MCRYRRLVTVNAGCLHSVLAMEQNPGFAKVDSNDESDLMVAELWLCWPHIEDLVQRERTNNLAK